MFYFEADSASAPFQTQLHRWSRKERHERNNRLRDPLIMFLFFLSYYLKDWLSFSDNVPSLRLIPDYSRALQKICHRHTSAPPRVVLATLSIISNCFGFKQSAAVRGRKFNIGSFGYKTRTMQIQTEMQWWEKNATKKKKNSSSSELNLQAAISGAKHLKSTSFTGFRFNLKWLNVSRRSHCSVPTLLFGHLDVHLCCPMLSLLYKNVGNQMSICPVPASRLIRSKLNS